MKNIKKWWKGLKNEGFKKLAFWAPTTFKDPSGNLRFRPKFEPKAEPNQAQKIRHGTHKPAHNDSDRFWADFCLFRRRPQNF